MIFEGTPGLFTPSLCVGVDIHINMHIPLLSRVIYTYYWQIPSYGLRDKNGYAKYPFKKRFQLPGVRGVNDRLSLADLRDSFVVRIGIIYGIPIFGSLDIYIVKSFHVYKTILFSRLLQDRLSIGTMCVVHHGTRWVGKYVILYNTVYLLFVCRYTNLGII